MIIKRLCPHEPKPSEISDEKLFAGRRRFLQCSGGALIAGALALPAGKLAAADDEPEGTDFPQLRQGALSTDETPNRYRDVTGYNNFYEFGSGKADPARNAHTLQMHPWSVMVEGAALKPRRFDIEEILKLAPLEERVYRLRCVEGWSMVIPWVGFPLAALLKRVEPAGNAKFVAFTTLYDPQQMPGQRSALLDWPYVEGLRMDEAMHPLTLLAVGVYGKVLPAQNGAPLRLVVPWKYGFKSSKSIVHIRLQEQVPISSWMKAAPREYGFYANVNPGVDHPRWSQSKERRIGEFFKRPTLMFNGYGEQVAGMYAGMDLKRYF